MQKKFCEHREKHAQALQNKLKEAQLQIQQMKQLQNQR